MADSKAPKPKDDDDFVINDSTQEIDDEPKKKELSSEPEPDAGEPSGKELEQAMTEAEQEAAQPVDKKPVKSKHKWTRKKIILLVTGALVLLIAVIMAIPAARYATLGTFIKRDVTIKLEDTKTKKPVSNVTISLGDKSATTDAKGQATLRSVAVGSKKVKATKKYYKDLNADVLVPITGANPSFDMSIEATGRQVPIKVINKISKQPVEGAQISVDGTSSKTDKNGEAVVVLPADRAEIDATLSQGGYNDSSVKVSVIEQLDAKNTFAVTPSGKLFFLSKRSGSIDVLKSDLDGANVQTVLKGTGKEDEYGTVLLASRDWKYLALKARRDSDKPKLYLIETSTGKLSVIDEGDADFDPVGWYNTHFVYTVFRSKVKNWEPKRYSLKSFNATSGSIAVLDEAAGEGDNDTKFANEYIGNVYILDNEIVYQKSWNTGELYTLSGKNVVINSIRPDGSNKKTLKSFPTEPGTYFGSARLYKPQEVYYEVYQKYQRSFWEYESNKFTEDKDLSGDEFYNKYYPTYLLSPSSKNTFWYEPRDGKNTLFVGDPNGENGKEILNLSEFTPYGWMGEDYLLVSKKGSELFIIPRSNPTEPMKITDYHKPSGSFYGYGYGYGGF